MLSSPSPLLRFLLFSLLSLADLAVTWMLLHLGEGRFYEANPLASWWLTKYGWSGLVLFKGLTVILVGVVCLQISRRRPQVGGRLLGLACAVLAVVVLYSCSLGGYVVTQEALDPNRSRQERLGGRLDDDLDAGSAYRDSLVDLAQQLIDQRMTLVEATTHLAETEKGSDPRWLLFLGRFHPGYAERQLLAINLIQHVGLALRNCPSQMHRVVDRLEEEFETAFGRSPGDLPLALPDQPSSGKRPPPLS